MLVISDQDMLQAGNQLLFRAIEGYIRGGFRVIFLTNVKDDSNLADKEVLFGDLAENLEINRVPVSPLLGNRRQFLKGYGRDIKEPSPAVISVGFPPPPEMSLPFFTGPQKPRLVQRLGQRRFEQAIWRAAIQIASATRIDLVCGYEVMAARVARRVANRFRVPYFKKYQGTFLYQALNEGSANRQFPLHLAGTRVPADLHVMENDGTRGLEVLVRLGHPREKILFLVDGVRKDIYHPGLGKEEAFAPYGLKVSENTKILLTLSKLSPWKRHDRIIGAMPAILRVIPDAYLVIAHRGSLREELERYAERLGVGKRVIFTGPVPHDQVYRFLNTCDVYINCNDHSNLSNTVLEALECGRPIVSLQDGSLQGIVTHGENGFLVDRTTVKADFPECIIRLLLDDESRKSMSQMARAFAERNLLSWEDRMQVEVSRLINVLME